MGVKVCQYEDAKHKRCDHELYSEGMPPMKVFRHKGELYCAECILNFPFEVK